MDAGTWIATGVGAYAAIVSTLVGIHQWRTTRPDVRVVMNLCIIHPPVYGDNPLVSISAGNGGTHTVTLTSAGWLLPNGMCCVIPIPNGPQPFPHALAAGAGHQLFVTRDDVQESLISEGLSGRCTVRPFYRDQVGRTHIGPRLTWDTRKRTLVPRSLFRRVFPKRLRVGGTAA